MADGTLCRSDGVPKGAGGGGGDIAVRIELSELTENPGVVPPVLEKEKDIGRAGLRGGMSKDILLGVPGVGEGGTLPPEGEYPLPKLMPTVVERKADDEVAVLEDICMGVCRLATAD